MNPNWFRYWQDALDEANFRSAITRYRYRVRFEPNNRWWEITETTTPLRK